MILEEREWILSLHLRVESSGGVRLGTGMLRPRKFSLGIREIVHEERGETRSFTPFESRFFQSANPWKDKKRLLGLDRKKRLGQ
jgi:hypothetical protein